MRWRRRQGSGRGSWFGRRCHTPSVRGAQRIENLEHSEPFSLRPFADFCPFAAVWIAGVPCCLAPFAELSAAIPGTFQSPQRSNQKRLSRPFGQLAFGFEYLIEYFRCVWTGVHAVRIWRASSAALAVALSWERGRENMGRKKPLPGERERRGVEGFIRCIRRR